MKIISLKEFGSNHGITLKDQSSITKLALDNICYRFEYSAEEIKDKFDSVFGEVEQEAYRLYLEYEEKYGKEIFKLFFKKLEEEGGIRSAKDAGIVMGNHFSLLDKFFLSLAQSRKARSGRTFETITNTLFRELDYPFEEQVIINGKPDFVMPSEIHYRRNPMDCIIFTTKRTLRERWRQIVTEGARGLGFFLATIDKKISKIQLNEMLLHRIYVVCPQKIIDECYNDTDIANVLSFKKFFRDHLDPAMERWKSNGVI